MQPSAIIVGVGAQNGLGAALCRRFSREGFHIFVAGRTERKIEAVAESIRAEGGSAHAVRTDASVELEVVALFDEAMQPAGEREPATVVIFNAGNNAYINFSDLTAEQFIDFWRVGCFAGFLVAREAARRLPQLGRGTVLFTGASASLRGKPGFAHFAAAKAGLRMISQSMARELSPRNIHVAHIVIDGGIDGDRLHHRYPDITAQRGENGLLNIEAIAETYWQLHRQHPSAWTQELDLRPFKEVY